MPQCDFYYVPNSLSLLEGIGFNAVVFQCYYH